MQISDPASPVADAKTTSRTALRDEWTKLSSMEADTERLALTPRERAVLQLAAEDLTSPKTAARLSLSSATVSTHFGNIYAKLQVHHASRSRRLGIRLGLIE